MSTAAIPRPWLRIFSARRRSQLNLVYRLAQRQLQQRYRDSALGLLWSVLSPLVLLCIYSFLYSFVFKARWSDADTKSIPYALLIFSGLLIFNLYAEIVNGSTFLVQSNVPLIKRTTASPRVLPLAASMGALMTFGFSLVPFAVMYVVLEGLPPWTAVLLPLLLVPLLVLCTGLACFLASAAAYIRDMQQLVPLSTTAVLFMSPIFYPTSVLPARVQTVLRIVSPLGVVVPASKDLLFFGQLPELLPLALYSMGAVVVFAFGWFVYGRAAKGFADVV